MGIMVLQSFFKTSLIKKVSFLLMHWMKLEILRSFTYEWLFSVYDITIFAIKCSDITYYLQNTSSVGSCIIVSPDVHSNLHEFLFFLKILKSIVRYYQKTCFFQGERVVKSVLIHKNYLTIINMRV